MLPRPTIEAFDLHVLVLGLRFEGVVIGGSALGLMGVIDRPTRDFDILVPELPVEIAAAARAFAQAQRAAGIAIGDDWLNNGSIQRGEILPTGTAFQLERRGADPRFQGGALRVPNGTMRDRPADVLTPEALVRRHAGYRNRVLMGPSFRADVWTALERAPDLSITEVARQASCSFATAWQATQDFRVLRAAGH